MAVHSFWCEDSLWNNLRKQAKKEGISISQLIVQYLSPVSHRKTIHIADYNLPAKIKKTKKIIKPEEYDDPPLDTNDRIINGERISYSSAIQDPDFTYEEWVEYPLFRVR